MLIAAGPVMIRHRFHKGLIRSDTDLAVLHEEAKMLLRAWLLNSSTLETMIEVAVADNQ